MTGERAGDSLPGPHYCQPRLSPCQVGSGFKNLKPDAFLRGSGLEFAVELLDQGLAVLVPLLVLADRADLRSGHAVETITDLLDVQHVVAGDREPLALDEA